MKDEELIATWEARIKSGQDYMKEYAKPNNWNLYRNYYRGEFDKGVSSKRKYSVAIIFAILRAMIPQIYFANPTVMVSNKVPGYYLASKIVQKIDNKMIHDTKLKYVLKESIREAGLCGTVPILNGYDTEYGYSPEFRETITDKRTGEEHEIGGTLLQFDQKTGNRIEYNSLIKPGQPWTDNIRPEYFIVPYGYSRLSKVPWVARMYIRQLEDVKLDQRLSNTKDMKANGVTNLDWFTEQRLHQKMLSQEKEEYVFLWEIKDLKTGRMMIMQEGNKKLLYDDVDYLQKFGNPYMELTFNYDSLFFWGLPDAKFLEDSQLAINEARTIQMQNRRLTILRFIYDNNIVDPEEIMKLLTEDSVAAIKADGDIDKAVKPFQTYVSPDFNLDIDAIRKDARELTGFSKNQTGDYAGGRRTATESQIVNMASQIRISERKDIVADLLVDILERYNKYIFSEWHVNQVEDIVGPDGKRYWVSFNYKQIDSNYAFTVDPESAQPVSSEQKKQEAIMAAQYIHSSPIIQMAMQAGKPLPYNLQALDRYVLSQFNTIPLDEIMPPTAGAGMNPEQPLPLAELQKKFERQEDEANANL